MPWMSFGGSRLVISSGRCDGHQHWFDERCGWHCMLISALINLLTHIIMHTTCTSVAFNLLPSETIETATRQTTTVGLKTAPTNTQTLHRISYIFYQAVMYLQVPISPLP